MCNSTVDSSPMVNCCQKLGKWSPRQPYSYSGHFHDSFGKLVPTMLTPCWVLLKLRMVAAVVTTGAVRRAKLQSNHHHQRTNTQPFAGWIPFQFCSTNSVRAQKAKVSHSTDYLTWGSSILLLITLEGGLPCQ